MPQPIPDDMLYVNICVYFNGLFYLYQVVCLKKNVAVIGNFIWKQI